MDDELTKGSLVPALFFLDGAGPSGRAVPNRLGSRLQLVRLQDTVGAYAAFVEEVNAGGLGGAHIHHTGQEFFLVLNGTFEFLVDETTVAAPQGASVRVPSGIRHGFRNTGGTPGRLLNIVSPATLAAAFEEMDALRAAGFGPGTKEFRDGGARHPGAVEVVEFPGWA